MLGDVKIYSSGHLAAFEIGKRHLRRGTLTLGWVTAKGLNRVQAEQPFEAESILFVAELSWIQRFP